MTNKISVYWFNSIQSAFVFFYFFRSYVYGIKLKRI